MPARPPKKRSSPQKRSETGRAGLLLYGHHAVDAALTNPRRKIIRLYGTDAALGRICPPAAVSVEPVSPQDLDKRFADCRPHQGLVLACAPLPTISLADTLSGARRMLILDQVTDPHNVGAMMRTARAFGVDALISQDRHSAPESGALAKAASGALETLPWVRVTNLARTLDDLAKAGFWRIGLAGEAETTLAAVKPDGQIALVVGAEGRGLRPNVAQHCDQLVRIDIGGGMESLNVSNAAAIALYALRDR